MWGDNLGQRQENYGFRTNKAANAKALTAFSVFFALYYALGPAFTIAASTSNLEKFATNLAHSSLAAVS